MSCRSLPKYALTCLSLLGAMGTPHAVPNAPLRAQSRMPALLKAGLPLDFVKNGGQVPGPAQFVSRADRYELTLAPSGADFHLRGASSGTAPIRMKWEGGRSQPEMSGVNRRRGTYSYFRGGDPVRWQRNVPSYAQVRYREVYPKVDLLFYGNDRQTEYDFIVAPGGDPAQIRLTFEGAEKIEINVAGELVLSLPGGSALRQKKPTLYQETPTGRKSVSGGYLLAEDGSVRFQVGDYDPQLPLVIDPVLTYSSLFGKADAEDTHGIARDKQGNLYLLGDTFGEIGQRDVVVLKFSPDGSQLLNNLVIGGLDDDQGQDIKVDGDGNVYLLVSSSSKNDDSTPKIDEGFPLTDNAYMPTDEFFYRTVVCKIDANFENLLYSSRFYADLPRAMALDAQNNVLITGATSSYIIQNDNVIQNRNRCQSQTPNLTPFVAKFDMTKSGDASLPYFTFFTGEACGDGGAIAVDAEGNAYVTGEVSGPILATRDAPQRNYAGGYGDAFVAKINPTGSDLLFATLLGGPSTDEGRGIGLDAQGNVYVAGSTYDGFPTTPGTLQADYMGGKNLPQSAFVTMYHPDGSVGYSTYLGGSDSDTGTSLVVDTAGNAYVGGYTQSTDFPLVNPLQKTLAGGSDAFLSVLNSSGSTLTFSTLLGGSEFDDIEHLALDEAKKTVIVSGSVASKDFPTVHPLSISGLPADPANRGNYVSDMMLAVIDLNGGETGPQTKPGDVNGDGKVSISDAILVLRASVGLETLTDAQIAAADLNHDAKVTVGDAGGVLRLAVGL